MAGENLRAFYGESRVQGLRDEIALDNYVNQFNSAFFKNGAVIDLMFVPKRELSQTQHKMLLDAMKKDLQGVDRMFQMFINRFPGEITHPDVKHKDIAFEGLLRLNREKIYAGFGLPPFRGGVMEYANYANALAQDKDFWNNTIRPIINLIEMTFNQWLVRPFFADNLRLRFDMAEVPALKGDPKEQADIIQILVNTGVLTRDEARERLDLPKLTTAEEDAEDAVAQMFIQNMRRRRTAALASLHQITRGGTELWWLDGSHHQAQRLFDVEKYNEDDATLTLPLRAMLYERCQQVGNGGAPSTYRPIDRAAALPLLIRLIQDRNRQHFETLCSMLVAADKSKAGYSRITEQVRHILSDDESRETGRRVSRKIDEWATALTQKKE